MRVVALVPDLMDRSKVAAAAPGVRFVRSPAELAAEVAGDAGTGAAGTGADRADLIVVDLSRPGVLDALPSLAAGGSRVVGFGSHVDRALLDAARAAGCSQVLARSAFFARLPELLSPA